MPVLKIWTQTFLLSLVDRIQRSKIWFCINFLQIFSDATTLIVKAQMAAPPANVAAVTAAAGPDYQQLQPWPWVQDERDPFIQWLRSEFAAANAIIDSLLHHLQSTGDPGVYDQVIGCVNHRRLNWTPVLHYQHFFPIGEVAYALEQAKWWGMQQRPRDGPRLHAHEQVWWF